MSPNSTANPSESLRTKIAWICAFAIGALLGAAVLYRYNPSSSHFYPRCLFHDMTGCYCPGCGSTRALYQMLHGRFLAAVRDNLLLCIAAPGIAVYALVNFFKPGFFAARFSPKAKYIFGGCIFLTIILFWILRNIPVFPFTLLAPVN